MKFNIPKKLVVGGVDYVVNIKDVLNYNEDFGYWKPQGTIDIARGVEGDRISESRMRTTFWHELTHAILDRMGRTDLNDSEEFVNTFSAFLSGRLTQWRNNMINVKELMIGDYVDVSGHGNPIELGIVEEVSDVGNETTIGLKDCSGIFCRKRDFAYCIDERVFLEK